MRKTDQSESAFVMEDGDRFYSIVVSDGIKYETHPGFESIITFFIIRRASGKFDITQVLKTFGGESCLSRNVHNKNGIKADRIDKEIADIQAVFTKGIFDETGYTMRWNVLNLADIQDIHQQVRLINEWGRVGVDVATGIPPIGLN